MESRRDVMKDADDVFKRQEELTVSLAGKDMIVNSDAVTHYLVRSGTNQAGGCDNHKDEESLCHPQQRIHGS